MEELKKIYGFPVKRNEKSVEIHSDCCFPQQSDECYRLYLAIQKIIIEEEKIKFPLKLKKYKSIIKPTAENLNNFFSMNGLMKYNQQYYSRLKDTITFYKPEIYFNKGNNLPTMILHYFELNYEGKLDIKNADDLSAKSMVHTKDINITTERIDELEKHHISIEWLKFIPLLPMERIKFDEQGNVMEFKHQKLNTE